MDYLFLPLGFLFAIFIVVMVTSYSIKLAYFVSMVAFAGVLFGYYVYRLGFADVQSSKIWMLFIIGG